MFYDYEVGLYSKGEKYKDKIGQTQYKNSELLRVIECDIQPYFKEQAYKEYGITVECSNKLFMDLGFKIIPNEQQIKYKDRVFEIIKVLDWEATDDEDFNFREVIINEVY